MSAPATLTYGTEFVAGATGPAGPANLNSEAAIGPSAAVAGLSRPFRGEASGPSPELRLIYETAPIGLAFLTPDCRYVLINQHLTEICGISIANHVGRSVRETVPQVADQVEEIVGTVVRSGEPITGIEVNGQRPDKKNAERIWMTHWHPLKNRDGGIVGINVVAEEITERKRAETALATSQERFRELADNMSQFAWTADPTGRRTWFNNRWYEYTGTTFEEMRGWGWQKVHQRLVSLGHSAASTLACPSTRTAGRYRI